MSKSVNKIILVGHVGRDPDLQSTAKGTRVAHLSLATSRRVARDGAVEERTEWHRLTLWDGLAEIAEAHVRKGDRLYVEGRMEYDSYERNGVSVPTAEVTVRELVLLGSPRGSRAEEDEASAGSADAEAGAEEEALAVSG